MRLRLDEATGRLTLTCPWRTSRRTALAWAVDQHAWIDAQIARAGPGQPLLPGAEIPIAGRLHRIDWCPTRPRSVMLADDALVCGGPESGLARRVETFLKAHALATLSREVAEFAAVAGVTASSVRIGDPKSRWGSCASNGRIRFSWRLILAPPEIRRYVVAHEVAHLRHLDHGAQFRALERQLVGAEVAQLRAALRELGPGLRRIGRLGL